MSNTGNRNTGDCNTGNWNTCDCNTGNRNTGDCNTGDRNTGNWNTGNWNTGDRNTGNWNTGDCNTGNCNTGNLNTGNRNTGDCNTGNWNTGYFNTETPKNILSFNKECSREDWENAEKPNFLYFSLTQWVYSSDMTQEEKNANVTHETCGGYLKVYDYKEAFQKSWNDADEEDRAKLFNLPNFDADVFFEISGIDVRENTECVVKQSDEYIEVNGVKYKRVD